MFTLYKKEIFSFLNSLIGYIAIIVFLLIMGLMLWLVPDNFNIIDGGYAGLDSFFVLAPFIFLFLIPAITMRSFTDEKNLGTIETLLTKPLTSAQIVISKYLAGATLVAVSLLPTILYFISVYYLGQPLGNIDTGSTIGSYIGLLLLASSFVAIGIFVSAMTKNQISAFVLTFLICGFFYIGFELISNLALLGKVDLIIQSLGVQSHYVSISRGVIDTRDILYFFSVIFLFIFLTKLSLESRKWESNNGN